MGWGYPLPLPSLCPPYDTPGAVGARNIIAHLAPKVKKKIEKNINKII